MNERKFLFCKHCGNLVTMIQDAGVKPVCCGEPMTLLVPNTVDAATEKHVPAVKKGDGILDVTVGSVEHPMTAEHYIMWIAVAQDEHTQYVTLSPDDKPFARFCIDSDSPITVYEYCNLHGLWSVEA